MEQTLTGVDLSPYVPRVATAWALDHPDQVWQAVEGSLVFADISGFTALSERLAKRGPIGAEELTEVLGDCFAGLLAVAYADGGSLLKFGGDALLIFFDGPAHELRAARTAIGMRAAIRTVGKIETSVGPVRLRMSQGVHSGVIHFFRVGNSHKELLICGPAATETVRMESAAEAGEIIVSPATAGALRELAPELVGEAKGPGTLLRNRTQVLHLEGFPSPIAEPAAAATGVPESLRSYLSLGGGEPEHRHVTVAFVHFDGIDGVIAEQGPEAASVALERLVADVQQASAAEGVTFLATDIDKDGGKIILVAGTPDAVEDAEGRLLRTVRRVADGADAKTLPVRVGVNRGHVFSGSVGPAYRKTYTVMGDAVNLSARLMAKARPGEVVVAPAVLELSRTAFSLTPLAPFAVKGKAAPVTASLLGQAVGTQETRVAVRTPLVGRDPLLRRLTALAQEGGQVVELRGGPGLGKTRMLEELRFAVRQTTVMRTVTCEQYQRATPYFAAGLLLRHVLGVRSSGERGAKEVVAALRRLDSRLAAWAPLVGDVTSLPVADTAQTRRMQPEFRRQRIRYVVADVLQAALHDGGVIAFDDIQWIDDASGEVVAHLVGTVADLPFTVVTTRRDDGQDQADEGRVRFELTPLDDSDARHLISFATSDAPLPPHRVTAIVRRAEGNPLFLEELVRMAQADEDAEFPESLEAVMATQVDALPPGDRKLLRFAAALGESFAPELLAEVVADDGLIIAEAATERLDGFLERTPDGRVQFRHRLIRDVAYRMLPFRLRRDLHGRAAQVIERRAGDDADDFAEILSLHCLHAQQYEKCWHYARVAGDRAAAKFASVEACEFYERAVAAIRYLPELDAGDLLRTLEALSRVRRMAGRYGPAREALDRARKVRSDSVALARLYGHHADLAEREGQTAAAFRWLQRALRTLQEDESPAGVTLRAALLVKSAELRHLAGRPRDALRLASAAIEVAAQANDEQVLARAYATIDWSYIALGRPDEATLSEQAMRLFEKLEQYENLAILANNRGAFAYFSGDWSTALRRYEQARAAFEEIGDVIHAAMTSGNIAEIYIDQARLDEAEAALQAALTTWRSMRFPVGVALATRFLARAHLRRGDTARAYELFGEAREAFERYGLAPKVLEVDTWVSECLLSMGRIGEAVTLLESCMARSIATSEIEMRAMIHRLQSYAAMSEGRYQDAWASIDESLAIATSRRMTYDVALAYEAMAALVELAPPADLSPSVDTRQELLASLGVQVAPAPPISLMSLAG